jgi:hypothetical protein
MTITAIGMAELRPGDVLLSMGRGDVSTAIQLLDGGEASHAAIWSGEAVIEATDPVVVEHSFDASLAMHPRVSVDVYRHARSAEFGNRAVVAARKYVGRRYSFGDLVLGGMLVATSSWLPSSRGQIEFLFKAARMMEFLELDQIEAEGLVTCVELVARAYAAAEAPLVLRISGARQFHARALFAGAREVASRMQFKAPPGSLEAEWEVVREQFREKYRGLVGEEVMASTSKSFGSTTASAGRRTVVAGIDWPANLVTPRDLETSPTLTRLGRLYTGPDAV